MLNPSIISQNGKALNGHANGHANTFSIEAIPEIQIPPRVLMGAGPSASYPEALRAMGANTLGHLDPEFIGIMSNVGAMLRSVFKTKNAITGAVTGSGTAGMEAGLCNLIEPGDEVLICVAGYFADRMRQMAERIGARVHVLKGEWGTVFTTDQVRAALDEMSAPKVVGIVHAETSTGAWQPIEEITQLAHERGALVVVDAVTSLAGCPLYVDDWDLDVCFSGTQKCIGSPPGLSPVTFNGRAMDRIHARKTPVQSWYLDMSLVETYWSDSGGGRAYHHTAPSNALFGLHEALRLTLLEGLENRWARHELHSRAIMAGLAKLNLEPFAQEGHRLWQLNAVKVPEGVDDQAVRTRLLHDYNIEISGGLGPIKGRVWRIGVMGYSAQCANIRLVLSALEDILGDTNHQFERGAATSAAQEIYDAHETELETKSREEVVVAKDLEYSSEGGMGETIPAESVAQGVAHEE